MGGPPGNAAPSGGSESGMEVSGTWGWHPRLINGRPFQGLYAPPPYVAAVEASARLWSVAVARISPFRATSASRSIGRVHGPSQEDYLKLHRFRLVPDLPNVVMIPVLANLNVGGGLRDG